MRKCTELLKRQKIKKNHADERIVWDQALAFTLAGPTMRRCKNTED